AKKTKEKADPFAKAPVVEDTVGIPQSIGDTSVDTTATDVEDTTGVVPPSFGGAADDTGTGAVVEDTTGAVPTMDDSPAVVPAAGRGRPGHCRDDGRGADDGRSRHDVSRDDYDSAGFPAGHNHLRRAAGVHRGVPRRREPGGQRWGKRAYDVGDERGPDCAG